MATPNYEEEILHMLNCGKALTPEEIRKCLALLLEKRAKTTTKFLQIVRALTSITSDLKEVVGRDLRSLDRAGCLNKTYLRREGAVHVFYCLSRAGEARLAATAKAA